MSDDAHKVSVTIPFGSGYHAPRMSLMGNSVKDVRELLIEARSAELGESLVALVTDTSRGARGILEDAEKSGKAPEYLRDTEVPAEDTKPAEEPKKAPAKKGVAAKKAAPKPAEEEKTGAPEEPEDRVSLEYKTKELLQQIVQQTTEADLDKLFADNKKFWLLNKEALGPVALAHRDKLREENN